VLSQQIANGLISPGTDTARLAGKSLVCDVRAGRSHRRRGADDLQTGRVPFPVDGDYVVSKFATRDRYLPPTSEGKPGRVRLNATQYFDNVSPDVWAYQVGGYQPAAKWLEDRTGRALDTDGLRHYRRMIVAITGYKNVPG